MDESKRPWGQLLLYLMKVKPFKVKRIEVKLEGDCPTNTTGRDLKYGPCQWVARITLDDITKDYPLVRW
jgi:hypothetical protein